MSGLKRVFETYEHSEHDHAIDLQRTIARLGSGGVGVRAVRAYISPLGTMLDWAVARLPERLRGSRRLAGAIQAIDAAFLSTAGRLWRRLGPRAATILGVKV
jgi:hypothetical protein